MGKKKSEKKKYNLERMLEKVKQNTTDITIAEFDARNTALFGANVNLKRYIPDIKDGLKPIFRRLFMSLLNLKLVPEHKHGKCSQIASKVTELYHPHSNDSVYETLVGLAQSWRNNVQFIDGDGNFGSAYDSSGYAAIN